MSALQKRKSSQYDNDEDGLSRIIVLSEEIAGDVVGEIIERILKINEQDEKDELEVKNFERDPIKLIINTNGGSVYDGLGLIDCMDASKTPIHTICYGSALSMGMLILVSGHVRIAGKYSTIMYHDANYGMEGKLETHKQEIKEVQRIEGLCDEILLTRTKLNKKRLQEIKTSRGEWYIGASEALQLKLVDKIL